MLSTLLIQCGTFKNIFLNCTLDADSRRNIARGFKYYPVNSLLYGRQNNTMNKNKSIFIEGLYKTSRVRLEFCNKNMGGSRAGGDRGSGGVCYENSIGILSQSCTCFPVYG